MHTRGSPVNSATLLTSHRLYNATPRRANAWRALFGQLFDELDLSVEIIAHAWPQPIGDLWSRPGLCCAFMCGWPFAKAIAARQAIHPLAVPVPAFAVYESQARYRSEFLVRSDSGITHLQQTFGGRYGWMVDDSQSGWNAPRHHLAQFVDGDRKTLFAETRGPYGNPRNLLLALQQGEIDVTALDGFYLDLMRADRADALDGLACIDVTGWTRPPLLVAAPDVEDEVAADLRERLLRLHTEARWQGLLADALIERFDPVDPGDYKQLLELEAEAIQCGYAVIR